ncbi:MAG: DUF5615 family PIN-like protein [Blastocatellia bacterium]|nr:DUF5615 family PIN-like protein [Blastocatellia bacterium]
MKLLFDHHLSPKLAARLSDQYPNSSHVYLLGMDQKSDSVIWKYARDHGYVIVTKDSDFGDLSLLRGHPPKVIWLRLGNCTTNQVEDAIRRHNVEIAEFAEDQIIGLITIFR